MTIDINELRRKLRSDDLIDHVDIHANVKPALAELLDRIEVAEKDIVLKEKIIDALGSALDAVTRERDDLFARIGAMEPTPSVPKLRVGNLPTLNRDAYPALGAWWAQLWDGDDVFARVYGSTPEEAHNRAKMLVAAGSGRGAE